MSMTGQGAKTGKQKRHWRQGSCHCGAVTFEVETPDEVELVDCNCSICTKSGYLHLIVPKARFRLLSGGDKLTTYVFNKYGIALPRTSREQARSGPAVSLSIILSLSDDFSCKNDPVIRRLLAPNV